MYRHMKYIKNSDILKVLADKMIDICGTPPEGAGLQNLRKAIIQMKYK